MTILIVEDEARIARRTERLLRQLLPNRTLNILKAEALGEGQRLIAENAIDLLILDLNLNGADGFDLLEALVAEPFHTIIISAYRDRAIRAFEYGVLDFVPKPYTEARLAQALQRLRESRPTEVNLKYLAVKKKGRRHLVDVAQLTYVQGAGVYTELHLRDGATFIHHKTLEALAQLLPPHFARIHKSYLVSMHEARELVIEPGSKYGLRLNNDEILPIGRTRYKDVREKWFRE